nr:MAG TPA: hypothetical protein [Caudoviricetes sp.]
MLFLYSLFLDIDTVKPLIYKGFQHLIFIIL